MFGITFIDGFSLKCLCFMETLRFSVVTAS